MEFRQTLKGATTTTTEMCDDFEDFSDREVLEKSWKKTIDGINKDGYRAGIDVGQEERLQERFNATFTLSSKLLFSISELRGIVSGKLSYNLMKPGTLSSDQEELLQNLLGDIVEYETELLKFSNGLYSSIQQEEELLCNSGTENNADISDRLAVTSCADENKCDSDMKDRPDVESPGVKLEPTDENNVVSELTEHERDNMSPAVEMNHFKNRLQTILSSHGS